mgnify:CR=1 FL=1
MPIRAVGEKDGAMLHIDKIRIPPPSSRVRPDPQSKVPDEAYGNVMLCQPCDDALFEPIGATVHFGHDPRQVHRIAHRHAMSQFVHFDRVGSSADLHFGDDGRDFHGVVGEKGFSSAFPIRFCF